MIDVQKNMPMIIAGVLALIAVVIAGSYFKQREARLAALAAARSPKGKQVQIEEKKVVVAKKDIIKGSVIDSKMVELKSIPVKFIQPGATGSIDRIIDKVTMTPITKGEQILRNKLVSDAADLSSLSYRTPMGKRAITIPVDNISSVGGMIRPDDYVDILGLIPQTMQVGEEQVTQYATVPLFQKVLVLAVGRDVGASKRSKGGASGPVSTITVGLEPQKATMVAFIQEQGGKLRFVLRSPSDTGVTLAQPVNWDTLFLYLFPDLIQQIQSGKAGGMSPMMLMQQGGVVEEEDEQPTGPQVEIYRGSQREVVPLLK